MVSLYATRYSFCIRHLSGPDSRPYWKGSGARLSKVPKKKHGALQTKIGKQLIKKTSWRGQCALQSRYALRYVGSRLRMSLQGLKEPPGSCKLKCITLPPCHAGGLQFESARATKVCKQRDVGRGPGRKSLQESDGGSQRYFRRFRSPPFLIDHEQVQYPSKQPTARCLFPLGRLP